MPLRVGMPIVYPTLPLYGTDLIPLRLSSTVQPASTENILVRTADSPTIVPGRDFQYLRKKTTYA